MFDFLNHKEIIEALDNSPYNSNTYSQSCNMISDLINNDKINFYLMDMIIDLKKNRKNFRALSFIISEMSIERCREAKQYIDAIKFFNDSRVAYDLSRPIQINMDNHDYAKFFYNSLRHENPLVSTSYFSLLPNLSENQFFLIHDVAETEIEKEIFLLFLKKINVCYIHDLLKTNMSVFIKRIISRLAEKNLDYIDMIKIIDMIDDEDIYNGYYFQSSHSIIIESI